jgi:hypothetical protein
MQVLCATPSTKEARLVPLDQTKRLRIERTGPEAGSPTDRT